jgi:hypothetical protein
MIRQCAWCLRLIDSGGARISQQPLPKLYEASHGMCGVCGWLWMGQVLNAAEPYAEPEEHSYKGRRMVAEGPPAPLQDTPVSAPILNEEMDATAPIIKRRE